MEAIGQLAGGVAHDFNNLLTVINGYSDGILKTLDKNNPLFTDLSQIREAGIRATVLTDQLLSFSRRQILRSEVLDLNDVVGQTQTLIRSLIPESIHLSVTLKSNLRAVKADPNQLNQILINLAINARDAMPHGGKLSIETANTDLDAHFSERFGNIQPGSFVRLSVNDTGTGIEDKTLPRIFEPFFTTKEQGAGTGLGLSMIYGLINQSNGCIDVETEMGKGTSFHIYLPQTNDAIQLINQQIDSTSEENFAGTETILLVEDEDMVREMAKKSLTRQGYCVLEADSGENGLAMVTDHGPEIDALLTDIVLPDISGPELAHMAQQKYPNIKVIFSSGHAPAEVAKHITLDADMPYVRKPFSPKILSKKRYFNITIRRVAV